MSARLANPTDFTLLTGYAAPANAVGDFVSSTGASVSASSTAFSNSGGVTFVPADVGKAIVIPGAGTGGNPLTTTLAAVSGATATLNAAASAAVPASYVSGAAVAAAGTGYAPGDTVAPSGGTSVIAAGLSVAATQVVSATVNAGGSGGTNGTQQVYGTTGTGKRFAASVTVSGGAVTAVLSITIAGSYTANPTSIAAEPVTGAGLTGATLTVVMGIASLSVPTPGNYSVTPGNPVSQGSTSGSGTGATFTLTFTTSGAWSYATDDTVAIAAATSPMFLPQGKNYYTSTGVASFNLKTSGFGAIKDSSQRSQAPTFVSQTSAPSSFGSTSSLAAAFTGDLSRLPYPSAKIISGAASLGQPSSGYQFNPESCLRYDYIQNNGSGFNSSTSGNGGRTGFSSNYVKVDQTGQGDGLAYYGNIFVNAARSGATSFLASPAGAIVGGQVIAGQSGVYLQGVGDINLTDNGYDAAAISFTTNLNRSVDIGALGAVWYGWRSQSIGLAPIDAHISVSGKSKIGIDLTPLTTNSSGPYTNAAMTLLGNDRIYLNATAAAAPLYASSSGTTYLMYSSANAGIQGVVANSSAFIFSGSTALLYGTVSMGVANNNRIQGAGAANGSSPILSVTGASDTDVDFTIAPKGAGLLKVGTSGSMSANAAIATVLGSVGPTGSHTTVQEWLTVKNSAGTTRYIPCF